MPCPFSDSWNTCAVPWKLVVICAGRLESRSICWIASTAWPSAVPGARLNEIVTEGCWPWWLTRSGPTLVTGVVSAVSGIAWPEDVPTPGMPAPGFTVDATPETVCAVPVPVVFMKMLESFDGSLRNSGFASRITW